MREHHARCLWPAAATLGEGPLWCANDSALYWVGILDGSVFRYTPAFDRHERCRMPFAVSALVPVSGGGLLCTAQHDICLFDPDEGSVRLVHSLQTGAQRIRINDGCCHPDGSFWFGTMDLDESCPSGAFYRLSTDGRCKELSAPYIITNGPAFSPNGDRAYLVDTLDRRILMAPVEAGMLSNDLQEFARLTPDEGYPDGLAIDADGGVWCAHWSGSRVTRFDADGRISVIIHLPVSNVTKCAFGGERLDRLYITTARKGLSEEDLEAQPLAGGLFEADVGYRGFQPASYQGAVAQGAILGYACFSEMS